MNKYELALVLSAKLEDEERLAALEKVKDQITRFGGDIKDIDEWGKKRLASPTSFTLKQRLPLRQKSSPVSVSWSRFSDSYA